MKNKDGISRQIWMFFCSVKLTVYLLVLLAVTSIIGTVVLQNGTPQQYVNLYGQGMYNLIQVFDLNDMYHAWWFLLLLLLLCINITVCSVERLSLKWKTIFPDQIRFNADRFLKSKNKQTMDSTSQKNHLLDPCERWLRKQVGTVVRQTDGDTTFLYAEKGRWTRLGVYVVHASVLLLLVGALIGAVFGFKASVRIDEGNQTGRVFESKTREPIDLAFVIRCNEFEVSFYDTGAPEEFRSISPSSKTDRKVSPPISGSIIRCDTRGSTFFNLPTALRHRTPRQCASSTTKAIPKSPVRCGSVTPSICRKKPDSLHFRDFFPILNSGAMTWGKPFSGW